jgi:hypothetical protein
MIHLVLRNVVSNTAEDPLVAGSSEPYNLITTTSHIVAPCCVDTVRD